VNGWFICGSSDFQNLDWLPDNLCPTNGCQACGMSYELVTCVLISIPPVLYELHREGEDIDGFGDLLCPYSRPIGGRIIGVELQCVGGHRVRIRST
jgi:hypothetical protein